MASSTTRREAPSSTGWVSELQTPRAPTAEWQDFEWDTEDATETNIVFKPLTLLDETLPAQDALRRYTVCREVPYGGLPDVHLALLEGAAGFRRTVAVQRLRHEPGSEQPTPGLSPDALLGCHVRHPNVIPVLDLIQVQGEFLLVMEYVISETLTQVRAQGNRPPIPISVAIASGILHALDAAHTARDSFDAPLEIVHAGLSPDTVLVGVDGITRLIHFGLSKEGRPAGSNRAPPKGRPGYFAPEQVFERRVDARTDLFAAAILLWESLAGRPLLDGDSPVDCMMRFLGRGTRPPSEMNPQVSDRLDAVLARALEPAPECRFQTAAEFAEALEAAVEPATRAEVSRYVEGLAWVSIREQRALLKDTRPEDDAPRAALASHLEPPPELAVPDEDEPTLTAGSLSYLSAGSDQDSHWAARKSDEATAVENRPVPTLPAQAPRLTSAPSIEFAPLGGEVRDLPSAPSAPLATPIPAAARIPRRAHESFHQSRPRVRRMWLWPSVVLVAGLALVFTLPRARHAFATGAPDAVTAPAPTPLAAPAEAQSSERILRLDELPLLSESADSEPDSKAKARPPRNPTRARKRPVSAVPSATHAELTPAPEAEPPIILDP